MAGSGYMLDPYRDWIAREGVPIHEDFGLDLLTLEVAPWPRLGARGAIALMKGRGDFVDTHLIELPPGGQTDPQKHLYEEAVYVLDGRGSTIVESVDGKTYSFEWETNSLFSLPLNTRYQHFNGNGSRPARLVALTNLPLMLNLFHNEAFVFDNPFPFPDRAGEDKYFRGEGSMLPTTRPGRHMWETVFVPDLSSFELEPNPLRGGESSIMSFMLAESTLHTHASEIPPGCYKKAHRHEADYHVFTITGEGYTLYWYEGEQDFQRFDWRHGTVFAPTDNLFHQHFNTSPEPARYLAMAFGSVRYPFTANKKRNAAMGTRSVKDGGLQIDFDDQDPRIHAIYEEELRRHGSVPQMKEFPIPAAR